MKKDKDPQESVLIIQSWWRGELSRICTRRLAKNLIKRKFLIREFVETEENYITDLSVMIADFKTPLLFRKILTKEQALRLFANVDQIRQLNELFFAAIFNQVQNYTHYKIIFANL